MTRIWLVAWSLFWIFASFGAANARLPEDNEGFEDTTTICDPPTPNRPQACSQLIQGFSLGGDHFRLARSAGLLFVVTPPSPLPSFCTGVLLSTQFVLTDNHCIPKTLGSKLTLELGYFSDRDPEGSHLFLNLLPTEDFAADPLDYGVLKVDPDSQMALEKLWAGVNCSAETGRFCPVDLVTVGEPRPTSNLILAGHGSSEGGIAAPLKVSSGPGCSVTDIQLLPGTEPVAFHHRCWVKTGSSGSPITFGRQFVGLHGRGEGAVPGHPGISQPDAVLASAILRRSPTLQAIRRDQISERERTAGRALDAPVDIDEARAGLPDVADRVIQRALVEPSTVTASRDMARLYASFIEREIGNVSGSKLGLSVPSLKQLTSIVPADFAKARHRKSDDAAGDITQELKSWPNPKVKTFEVSGYSTFAVNGVVSSTRVTRGLTRIDVAANEKVYFHRRGFERWLQDGNVFSSFEQSSGVDLLAGFVPAYRELVGRTYLLGGKTKPGIQGSKRYADYFLEDESIRGVTKGLMQSQKLSFLAFPVGARFPRVGGKLTVVYESRCFFDQDNCPSVQGHGTLRNVFTLEVVEQEAGGDVVWLNVTFPSAASDQIVKREVALSVSLGIGIKAHTVICDKSLNSVSDELSEVTKVDGKPFVSSTQHRLVSCAT